MKKPTALQRDLIGILKNLGGQATTRQISEASGRAPHPYQGPRIGTNSVSFSLGQATDYVEYCGMASKGNASWHLVKEPEPKPAKKSETGPQSGLNFEDASTEAR